MVGPRFVRSTACARNTHTVRHTGTGTHTHTLQYHTTTHKHHKHTPHTTPPHHTTPHTTPYTPTHTTPHHTPHYTPQTTPHTRRCSADVSHRGGNLRKPEASGPRATDGMVRLGCLGRRHPERGTPPPPETGQTSRVWEALGEEKEAEG